MKVVGFQSMVVYYVGVHIVQDNRLQRFQTGVGLRGEEKGRMM